MKITPNFHFKDKCEEALHLYEKAFNSKITILLKNTEANSDDISIEEFDDDEKSMVYHAEMIIGEQRFMFSESADNLPVGNNISIVITFDSDEEVMFAYNLLKDEGQIIHAITSTSYSSCFVSLIDKYGMRWELMTENY